MSRVDVVRSGRAVAQQPVSLFVGERTAQFDGVGGDPPRRGLDRPLASRLGLPARPVAHRMHPLGRRLGDGEVGFEDREVFEDRPCGTAPPGAGRETAGRWSGAVTLSYSPHRTGFDVNEVRGADVSGRHGRRAAGCTAAAAARRPGPISSTVLDLPLATSSFPRLAGWRRGTVGIPVQPECWAAATRLPPRSTRGRSTPPMLSDTAAARTLTGVPHLEAHRPGRHRDADAVDDDEVARIQSFRADLDPRCARTSSPPTAIQTGRGDPSAVVPGNQRACSQCRPAQPVTLPLGGHTATASTIRCSVCDLDACRYVPAPAARSGASTGPGSRWGSAPLSPAGSRGMGCTRCGRASRTWSWRSWAMLRHFPAGPVSRISIHSPRAEIAP